MVGRNDSSIDCKQTGKVRSGRGSWCSCGVGRHGNGEDTSQFPPCYGGKVKRDLQFMDCGTENRIGTRGDTSTWLIAGRGPPGGKHAEEHVGMCATGKELGLGKNWNGLSHEKCNFQPHVTGRHPRFSNARGPFLARLTGRHLRH